MMNDEFRTPGPASGDPVPSFSSQQSAVSSHTIRLRGAWSGTPAGARSHHVRRFGWPTALDPHERVWLVCTSVPGPATVSVNGSAVGGCPPGECPFAADITQLLLPRNELIIEVPAGAPLGEVGLEVRPAGSAPTGTVPCAGDVPTGKSRTVAAPSES
jgi:hypothetical protein